MQLHEAARGNNLESSLSLLGGALIEDGRRRRQASWRRWRVGSGNSLHARGFGAISRGRRDAGRCERPRDGHDKRTTTTPVPAAGCREGEQRKGRKEAEDSRGGTALAISSSFRFMAS